ncbi:hypothetical protein UFOVP997_34 [uncultured Caudovirales phage]|uniref:Uncharacterized protein n=1 Tax=uncultured Caudovirales phage TaxID=2100421 RepID=A0A6J5RY71_9CAUD|nr:hypothetical protein UFOVP486_37 [uncultured Caudovirales phage]CAB4170266.1 hypothetical protein UFOVP911_18 [uncultured Caudovirales phage]CAB4177356.1 hypothetical protein UFOVP997_34 [uncultured Caudovirales phage]CAB4182642.1 hypothetical protein UFOVP1088_14 [uncultured Caudovirales phage]CAB4186450.1 hypothetical protein UFOVP1149_49 [uncultured Caudovirales phage]
MRTRNNIKLNEQEIKPVAPAVAGNTRAGKFLRDAVNRVDSVDIVTIGDSNTGYGEYGHTVGLDYAMRVGYGVQPYATPMQTTQYQDWGASNSRSESFYGNGVEIAFGETSGNCSKLSVGTFNANADATGFCSYIGFNPNVSITKQNGWRLDNAFVASGTTYLDTGANRNYVKLLTTSELNLGDCNLANPMNVSNIGAPQVGGVSAQYRFVYGTFATSGGSFKLRVMDSSLAQLGVSPTVVSTAGGYGYATTTVDFTTPTATYTSNVLDAGSIKTISASWAGQNQTGLTVNGPFVGMWQSIIRKNFKGYAVSNLIYHGGASAEMLATYVSGLNKNLESYLKEIKERQIEAGGSGRAIIKVMSGINESASDNVGGGIYTTASGIAAWQSIKTTVSTAWVAIGGSLKNLAFIFEMSQPYAYTYQSIFNSWNQKREIRIREANTWANNYAGDGNGACVVDINKFYNAFYIGQNRAAGVTTTTPLFGFGFAEYTGSGQEAHMNSSGSNGTVPISATARQNAYNSINMAVLNALIVSK